MKRYAPRWLAVLGVTAFRSAFDAPAAAVGPQSTLIETSRVWRLPNPSGLNAHVRPADLAREFGRLKDATDG